MKEIGQQLRQKRESKQISLEEVAASTKIGLKLLQALEEGEISKLPAKPFIRGFIQSYAKYLGLDQNEILRQFQASVGEPKTEPQYSLPDTEDLEKKVQGTGRNIMTTAGILVLVLGIILIWRILAQRESEMRGADPQAITGKDVPVQMPPVQIPKVEPTPVVLATPLATIAPTPIPTPLATPMVLTPKVESTVLTEAPKVAPLVEKKEEPKKPLAAQPTGTPSVNSPTGRGHEIIVEALDKTTIELHLDGGLKQTYSLQPDQIMTFKAKTNIKFKVENGGAVSLIHNGVEVGVPGNLGQPKVMEFKE